MTHDEFIAEYHKVAARVRQLSEKVRREGLLSLEDEGGIDYEKAKQRDILEYGLTFALDGTDGAIIHNLLSNIIEQEDDKYTRQLMKIKMEAVIQIQGGSNTRMIVPFMNSLTDLSLTDDPFYQEYEKQKDENRRLSEDEIDALIGGRNENQKINLENPKEYIDFEKLVFLNDRAVQKVLREVDSQELARALKSVDKDIRRVVLRNMTKRTARMLIEDMEYMGPVRLKDVEEAQMHISLIMRHLVDTGEIVIPSSQDKMVE